MEIPVSGIGQQKSGEWASGGFDIPVQDPPRAQVQAPRVPARLSIVLPFVEREVPRVLRLLDWMAQLSGELKRAVYLLPFKGLDISKVQVAAAKAFSDVQVIRDSEGVSSDWDTASKTRDAAGPNSLFRQAAWFFYLKPLLGPWLWLEPDCVPLTPTWDDELEAAYRSEPGKPFMGVGMKWQNGDEYLNGAAIYPQNAVTLVPSLATRTMWTQNPEIEIAFDVAGGADVLRQAHFTDLIQLAYRSDKPTVRDGVVLFHGDQNGKLLDSLFAGGREVAKPTGDSSSPETKRVGKARSACAGSNPAPRSKSSKRKRGPTIFGKPVVVTPPLKNGVNLEKIWHEIAHNQAPPTVGDEIRHHVAALVDLASNSNRKARILSALRKTTLLPKSAR